MADATTHELKCWPEYFEHVLSGAKPFELRMNDRNFGVGDSLHLREWSPSTHEYTGRGCWRRVTYVLPLEDWGCGGKVAMGLAADTNEAKALADECKRLAAACHDALHSSVLVDLWGTIDRLAALAQQAGTAPQAQMQHMVYAWLGRWRDTMPADAVTALQNLLGPLDVAAPQAQPSEAEDS